MGGMLKYSTIQCRLCYNIYSENWESLPIVEDETKNHQKLKYTMITAIFILLSLFGGKAMLLLMRKTKWSSPSATKTL